MATSIVLPTSSSTSSPTSQFPSSGSNGLIESEVDTYGNSYQWAWNAAAGLWLSPSSFFTGIDGQSTNGFSLNILTTVLTTDFSYQLPGGCLRDKIWLVKTSIISMPYGNSTLGGTYFTSTTNELDGINNYIFTLGSFTTKTSTLNVSTVFDTPINQVFNSRLMNWHVTIAKTGTDLIALRLNFGLEYKLIRY